MFEKQDVKWGERVAQVIGVACVVVVAMAVFPGWDWIVSVLKKDSAPAWVQAVGSVLALFIAIFISGFERENDKRNRIENEKDEYLRGRALISASVNRLGGSISAAHKKFKPGGNRLLLDSRLTRVILEEEIEISKALPVHIMSLREQKLFFAIRLQGVKIIQTIMFAESSPEIDGNGQIFICKNSYDFIVDEINLHLNRYDQNINEFKEAWAAVD